MTSAIPAWLPTIPRFLHSQFLVTPPYPTTSCTGRTIIITGSNVGLGFEAARHFARLHATKVILAVRSLEKGFAAKRAIEASTGCAPSVLEVWHLDLSSYASIQQFASRCANDLDRIDAVIENAAIVTRKFELVEKDESTITVNVVSTFLLALLLLPKLKQVAKKYDINPRLSIITSEVHYFTTFPERNLLPSSSDSQTPLFSILSDPATANMSDRYQVSKLLEVLACRAICAQHPNPPYPVVINLVNPGFCHSELAREMKDNWGMWVMKAVLARTTEVGSRTLVHAALAGPDTHGRYLSDCRVTAPAPLVESLEGEELQRRVWGELGVKLEGIQPGILGNL